MTSSPGPNSDLDSDNDDEVFAELSRDEIISTIKYMLKNVQIKTRKYRVNRALAPVIYVIFGFAPCKLFLLDSILEK